MTDLERKLRYGLNADGDKELTFVHARNLEPISEWRKTATNGLL